MNTVIADDGSMPDPARLHDWLNDQTPFVVRRLVIANEVSFSGPLHGGRNPVRAKPAPAAGDLHRGTGGEFAEEEA